MEVASVRDNILKSLKRHKVCVGRLAKPKSEEPQGWSIAGIAHCFVAKRLWPRCCTGVWISPFHELWGQRSILTLCCFALLQ